MVADETQKPNDAVAKALAAALQAKSANASHSLFTPEFLSEGIFDKAFAGSQEVFDKLEITSAADVLLLGRQTVQYSTNEALQGVITATTKLELSALSARSRRQVGTEEVTATGAGFKGTDARALAEERLIKQINGTALEPFWKAVLQK